MKKTNLLLVLAAASFAFVGCSNKKPATTTSSNSSVTPASSNATSQVTPASSSDSKTSQSSIESKTSVSSKPAGNIFELALQQDYTNMYAEVTQSYNNGEDGEYTYETYYNGYTIIFDENASLYGYDPYCYYHNYNGESYMYFTPDTNAPTPKAAWLNKGYMDAPLGLDNTYFSMETLLANISASDVSYSTGVYYINSPEKVEQLNQTAFQFAWFNDLSDISFTIEDGRITSIVGFDDLNNEKNFVKIMLKSQGSATFDESKLPAAPNEDNVMEYWQYKGWDGPYVEKYVTSIVATVDETEDKAEGFDAVLDIEHSVKVSASYLPLDANKKTIYWRSSNEDVAKVTYDKDGNRVIYAVGEGEATIYAYNNENKAGEVVSNGIKVKVKGLQAQNKEGAVYDLTYKSMIDGSIVVENSLDDTLPVTVTGTKTVVQDGKNSEIWEQSDMCVVMDPSTTGTGGSVVTYNFGDQQVSGISFYYAMYYSGDMNNIAFISSAVIETSNDGESWTTIDILDELKANVSAENLKLMEKTFAPASMVRISLNSSIIGRNVHFAFTEMAFIANEDCHAHTVAPDTVDVTEITASATKTTLYAGKTATMSALVGPADATDKSVTWVSSDQSIATVDENGVVTAVSAGTVQIYAVNEASGVESNMVTFTINAALTVDSKLVGTWEGEADSGLDEVTIVVTAEGTLTITRGEAVSTMSLVDYEDRYYVFQEDDSENFVKIKASSSLTNVAEVRAEMGAYTVGKFTGAKDYNKNVPLTSITLTADKTSVVEGGTIKLSTTLNPKDTTDKTISYASSDETVATVSTNGTVTAKTAGTVTITVTSQGGVEGTIELTVTAKTYPTSVTVSGEKSVELGKTITLTATISPTTATEKDITWSSKDTTIATVNKNGVVTAKKTGTVVIVATSADSTVFGEYTVTVTPVSNEKIPSAMVGTWTGEDSYNIEISIVLNGDGTGTVSNGEYEEDLELESCVGNVYTYNVSDDTKLFITFDGETFTLEYYGEGNIYCYFEGEEFTKA